MLGKGQEAARIGLTAHTAVLHKLVSKGFEGETILRLEPTGKQGKNQFSTGTRIRWAKGYEI